MPRKYVLFYVLLSSFTAHVEIELFFYIFSLNMILLTCHFLLIRSCSLLCRLMLYSCGFCVQLIYSCWNGFYYSFPLLSLLSLSQWLSIQFNLICISHLFYLKKNLAYIIFFVSNFASVVQLHAFMFRGVIHKNILFSIDFISAFLTCTLK